MWRNARVWLAAAGALAVVPLTSACHVTTSAGSSSASSSSASSPVGTSSAASSASAGGPAHPALSGRVVALGDSYTAGALLPLDAAAEPPGCLRSTEAYPVLVAGALGVPLTNAACVSAGVKDMTDAQHTYRGTNPAQLTVVGPDDALVVLTLGGDDVGFLNVLKECAVLSFTHLSGSPCEAHYTKGGTDQLAAGVTAEASKIAQVLTAIVVRAPRARIVVVGYPDMFPRSGGCWPAVPITAGDVAYLRGIEVKANAMLAAGAKAAGATYVDTYTPTIGHDFCASGSVRDVEGLLPGSLTLPFHPNVRGQQAMATAVLNAING